MGGGGVGGLHEARVRRQLVPTGPPRRTPAGSLTPWSSDACSRLLSCFAARDIAHTPLAPPPSPAGRFRLSPLRLPRSAGFFLVYFTFGTFWALFADDVVYVIDKSKVRARAVALAICTAVGSLAARVCGPGSARPAVDSTPACPAASPPSMDSRSSRLALYRTSTRLLHGSL